jgi:preprotein translocase subunit SecE
MGSMAKQHVAGNMISGLFQFSLYKRSQGRYARQATFIALAVGVVLGCWQLFYALGTPDWFGYVPMLGYRYAIAGVLAVLGVWVSFRAIQLPRFADFLIAVEAEMNKVSWPSRGELIRSSIVVIFVIFALAGVLFFFDMFWQKLFSLLQITYSK